MQGVDQVKVDRLIWDRERGGAIVIVAHEVVVLVLVGVVLEDRVFLVGRISVVHHLAVMVVSKDLISEVESVLSGGSVHGDDDLKGARRVTAAARAASKDMVNEVMAPSRPSGEAERG